MIGYIVLGAAAALDGFAAGVYVGRKWGAKLTPAAIQADGAAIEAKVEKVEAQAKAVEATVTADVDAAKAAVAPAVADAAAIEAKLKALVEASKK